MKKVNIKNLSNGNDNIVIKKSTALKLISGIPISFVAYKLNSKLDFIAEEIKNNKEEILFLKRNLSEISDKLHQIPINKAVTAETLNIGQTKASNILTFLADSSYNLLVANSFNIVLGVLGVTAIYFTGKAITTAIIGSGFFQFFRNVNETAGTFIQGAQNVTGDIIQGTQTVVIATGTAGSNALTSVGGIYS